MVRATTSPTRAPVEVPTAVLVLGMHRSGTSVLTRALNLLGVELGRDLMAAVENNNETGFWEHQGVVDAHEALMAAFGMRWDDPRAMPDGWLDTDAAKIATARIQGILDDEFADTRLWGVKDPRMCRVLPLWLPILEARGIRPTIVHMVRNPMEVARSLERRDAIPRGRGLLLWLRHQLESILSARDLPLVWTEFDRVMSDWREVAAKIDGALDLGLALADTEAAAKIDGFVRSDLRHHVLDGEALARDPNLKDWVGAVFTALDGPPDELIATAERVTVEMDRLSFYFDDTFASWAGRELELLEQVRERDGAIRERDSMVSERDSMIRERDGRVAERDNRILERDSRIRQFDRQIQDLRQSFDRERTDWKQTRRLLETHVTNLKDDRDRLVSHIETIRRSVSWRITAPIRIGGQIGRRVKSIGAPVTFEVRAQQHLLPIEGGFLQAGGDPHFHLPPLDGRPVPGGFVHLSYTFQTANGLPGQPRLYWDAGGGFTGAASILLPATSSGPVRITIELPEGVQVLRFDPPQNIGPFNLSDVTVTPLTTRAADLRAGFLEGLAAIRTPSRLPSALGALRSYLTAGPTTFHDARTGMVWTGKASTYEDWIEWYDTVSDADRDAMRQRIEGMAARPLISVVMPVYNTPHRYLREAIESVQAQVYPDWELCIANDASSDPGIAPLLDGYAKQDARIKIVHREANGHISAASNSALDVATGTFVALLDHDDVLAEHALYMVAEAISADPEACLFYSDEDKLDADGKRLEPYFKPDFNPELFHGQNFVSHLGVYRRSVLDKIGGFRIGLEGSQDYDLALRVVNLCGADKVHHIPHILYHWRILEGSVALSSGEKDYAHERALKALSESLAVSHPHAEVEEISVGRYRRVKHPLPDPAPKVSLIVPTRDRLDLTRVAVESVLERTEYPDFEVLIVDNGSVEEDTLAWFAEIAERDVRVRIIRDEGNFNFSRLNNAAAEQAEGSILCLLNNDTEIIGGDWLAEMVSRVVDPEVGIVGAKLLYTDGRIQHAGVVVGLGGIAGHMFSGKGRDDPCYFARGVLAQAYSAVTAACLVIEKSVFDEVDGLNETNLGVAFNDVDLCLKVRETGRRLVWTPFAELYHHESASRGFDQDMVGRARFQTEIDYMQEQWGSVLSSDPFHNPNLSLLELDCVLAFPPRVMKPWKSARRD
jgi:GT2 family glycosyltransferase